MSARRLPLPAVVHDRKNRPEGEGAERPVPAGVAGVMEAVCGYARAEGRHVCSQRGGCEPSDWQRVRMRVVEAIVVELRACLEAEDAHEAIVDRIAELRGERSLPPAVMPRRRTGYCPCCRRGASDA